MNPRQWHELPAPLQLLRLSGFRRQLREQNLHDTFEAGGEQPRRPAKNRPAYRTYDGSGYDPDDTDMGAAGTRFDRNVPVETTHPDPMPDLMTPSPREVSRHLLARDSFIPARSLNLLAAAWIHFQNHDWFSHGRNPVSAPLEVPLAGDDPWPERTMLVRRTRPDPVPHEGAAAPTYQNTVTHWWDGSQLYGSSESVARRLRAGEGGRLAMDGDRLPEETDDHASGGLPGIDMTGFADNYWVGLSLLHTLFAREHNAICAMLARAHPSWDDERLFQTARLVNAAVMAKIHTIEWTPALLDSPGLRLAMRTNWHGVVGSVLRRRTPWRFGENEVLSGILGSPMNHHGSPYAITEEFVSCYRMHPLIADEWRIHSHLRGEYIDTTDFEPLQGHSTRTAVDKYGMSDLFYSFGIGHPGAITLHNHPDALRNLRNMFGEHIDLGAVDVLRDRERGVPRYAAFREMLGREPVTSFQDITPDQRIAAELAEVYDGRVDRVDTMVGMYAERPPAGFAFSDTAFRVFILMASRRLKSDPFFTDLYNAEVYSPEGLAWIERATMTGVLLRHHPELAPALAGTRGAFGPWRRLS
ncbi:peroxidase family protein [Nonomuraea longicatena]|uniref:Peroxidase family protein n=1 Tax=Nonomuraea longicatena TaxID=83682 RepID=A0ABN1QL53_9ACTN